MGQYNPHARSVVGNEYAPVLQSNWTPDLFVERGYSFRHDDSEILDGFPSMFVDKQPAWAVPGHAYLFTLYRRGQETNTGPMKTTTVPFIYPRGTANILDSDGGSGGTNDCQFVTDGRYVRFRTGSTGESYLRMAVNDPGTEPFGDVQFKRIVDVSIRYAASAEPGNENPVPLQINHYNVCRNQRVSYGTADVRLRESLITELSRSRWGEVCTWSTLDDPFTEDTSRYPWNYNLLNNFAGISSDWAVEFRTESAAQDGPREIYLHFAEMVITYCEENRVASAGFVLGSDYTNPDIPTLDPFAGYLRGRNTQNSFGKGFIDPQLLTVDCSGGTIGFGAGTTGVLDLTVTLKRADYGPYNNQGALPELRGLRTVDVFPGHPGVVINNTLEPGQLNTISTTDLLPQVVIHTDEPEEVQDPDETPAIPFVHPYGVQEPLPVYLGNSVVQEIVDTGGSAAGNTRLYDTLRFWARHRGATAALQIWVERSALGPFQLTQLTTEDLEQFPEVADGWREVTLTDLSPRIGFNGGEEVQGPAVPRWMSDTPAHRPWEVLAVRVWREGWDSGLTMPYDGSFPSQTGIATYGNRDAEGGIEGAFPTAADIDVSVYWVLGGGEVPNLAVTEAVQPIEVVDPDCPIPPECIADGIRYLALTWEPVLFGYQFVAFDHYEVQRQDDTMASDEWETIARPIHPEVTEFDDYEARVGVPTRYRIRWVDQVGVAQTWSDPVAAEVGAPGVTGIEADKGVLVFTSNSDPDRNLAYVQTWSGAAVEDFDFVEAETRELQRMYGRDYQVAFRPLERGGVRFSRSLLVNAVRIPVETLRRGFESLRDLAWADLPYIAVRSDRGDRWLANVNVPNGSIRDRRRLYVAEVGITEVTDQPFAPEPTICEGMTARGSLPSTVYEPRFATTPVSDQIASNDLDIRVELRLDQDGQRIPLVARYQQYAVYGWIFELRTDNTLRFFAGPRGTGSAAFDSDPIPFLPGERFWARIDYDWMGGGATSTAQFYTSEDGSTWDPLATTTVSNDPIPASVADGSQPLPLTIGATFDGTSDYFAGDLFGGGAGGWNGVISRVQILGDADDAFTDGLFLQGLTGAYAATPNSPALSFTGDIDVRVEASRSSWAAPATEEVLAARYNDSTDDRSWRFSYDTDGALHFRRTADGTSSTIDSYSSTVGLDAVTEILSRPAMALRVTRDASLGEVIFYTAPTILGPWTQLGDPVSGSAGAMFAGNADLEAGARNNGTQTVWDGAIEELEVRDGIGGTLVANPDFDGQPTNTTMFVDGVGNTWTVHGSAQIFQENLDESLLADPDFEAQDGDTVGFIDSQGNSWNVSGGICTVDRRS